MFFDDRHWRVIATSGWIRSGTEADVGRDVCTAFFSTPDWTHLWANHSMSWIATYVRLVISILRDWGGLGPFQYKIVCDYLIDSIANKRSIPLLDELPDHVIWAPGPFLRDYDPDPDRLDEEKGGET